MQRNFTPQNTASYGIYVDLPVDPLPPVCYYGINEEPTQIPGTKNPAGAGLNSCCRRILLLLRREHRRGAQGGIRTPEQRICNPRL